MKKALQTLPDGYTQIFEVDLQKSKKMAIILNVLAVAIAIAMAVPVAFIVPFFDLFDMSQGLLMYALRFLALILGLVAYIILHELTHGIAMKICGSKKIKYGFTLLYAFAGSNDYYSKGSYIFIALAPVVLWGVILGIICPFLPPAWFWVVYIIQITNIAGAAGDFYVTAKFSRFPADILVQDSGVGMKVYSQTKNR